LLTRHAQTRAINGFCHLGAVKFRLKLAGMALWPIGKMIIPIEETRYG
jgi:uncharacterized membrane protein YccF (DUF307 family)